MKIELTEQEVKVTAYYLKQAIIDVKGMAAIGVGSYQTAKILESVTKKLASARNSKGVGQINLGSALKLLALQKDDDELYLQEGERTPAQDWMAGVDCIAYTVKEVKNEFDLEKTKVAKIRPYFSFGEYEGFLLIIERGRRLNR